MAFDWGVGITAIKEAYERDGYVIVDGIFDSDDTGDTGLSKLRDAAEKVTSLTRAGQWPHRRVIGKQFPPFDDPRSNPDSWGVQHLLHPTLDKQQVFARFYASSPLIDICAALLGVDEGRMQLELFNLLIEPGRHNFALGWHRDDIRPDVPVREERRRLEAPLFGIQWNAALWDDDCLFLVPGTHKRVRTELERQANETRPPEAVTVESTTVATEARDEGAWRIDPPSTKQVHLRAGQTAFYSQRILHRASYLASKKRATLHGCYGGIPTSDAYEADGKASLAVYERARMVLQHGVEWMREDDFGQGLPDRLQPLWRNLLEMEGRHSIMDLGYSLDG